MENLMKTLVSMESELKDVKNNQKKIILRHNALKDNPSAASSENASSLPVMSRPNAPDGISKSNKDEHKNYSSSTSNQATQNVQPESIEPSLYETEINKIDLGLEIAKLSQHIEELYIKFNLILAAIAKLEFSIDELEQYGRNNCLILHGLHNFPNAHSNYDEFLLKVITTLNLHLNLSLDINCVDIAHPLPTARNGNTPIIIKFLRRSTRNQVFKRKRLFSRTGLAVTESLTKRRLSLLNEAKSLLGDKNVWTYKGTVFTNINSKHEKIVSQEALYNLVTELGD